MIFLTANAKVKVKGSISIEVLPPEVLRSRWISLLAFMTIKETRTNFELFKTRVFYDTTSVLQSTPLVLTPEHIWQLILVIPSWATNIWEDEIDIPVTVITDSEVIEGSFDIKLLPELSDPEKKLQ